MLPCMGSQIQVTVCPARSTACTRAGSLLRSFWAPMRTMMASLPGVFSGLKACSRSSAPSQDLADLRETYR